MHFERANSPQSALQIFDAELIKLNLSYILSSIGTTPLTTRCWLCTSDCTIAVGNGKGMDLQSEVSAKYEALEHYLCTQRSLLQNECLSFTYNEIENSLSPLNQEILPIYFKKNCKTKVTPWISFTNFSQDRSILLPYYLTNPEYRKRTFAYDEVDYTTLSEFPTNNGTAIGTTFEEANVPCNQ